MDKKESLIDYKRLLESIHEDFESYYKASDKLENSAWNYNEYDEVRDYEEMVVKDSLKSIHRKIIVILEVLGLTETIKYFKVEFNDYKKNLTAVEIIPMVGEFMSPSQHLLYKYYKILNTLLDVKADDILEEKWKRSKLLSILKSTSKIIRDYEVDPSSEKDVKKYIYNVLTYTFPDTVREMPIIKNIKNFKPDLGIKSISTAIEYKYANNENEVKVSLCGILEDVKGYSKNFEWNSFIAIIYMTDAFFTDEQVQEFFEETGLPENWKIITLNGRGNRKRRK